MFVKRDQIWVVALLPMTLNGGNEIIIIGQRTKLKFSRKKAKNKVVQYI